MSKHIRELRNFLNSLPGGSISDIEVIESRLAACWDDFHGRQQEGMSSDKLFGRMEEVEWDPPVLSFVIERHGATVRGSTRAEKQQWVLNLDEQTAHVSQAGFRQVRPKQPALNVTPLAEELAELIRAGEDDARLAFQEDGTVRVLIGKVIPAGVSPKETIAGRRRRFRAVLGGILGLHGWTSLRPNKYAPPRQ